MLHNITVQSFSSDLVIQKKNKPFHCQTMNLVTKRIQSKIVLSKIYFYADVSLLSMFLDI